MTSEYQMLHAMFTRQIDLNERVSGEDWHSKSFKWTTAIWTECAELMETTSWKWWKNTELNRPEFISELVDVWHFGMSTMMLPYPGKGQRLHELVTYVESLAIKHNSSITNIEPDKLHDAIERIAMSAVLGSFNVDAFFATLRLSGYTLVGLYQHYIAKSVLNHFRAEQGYLTGGYAWNSKQDNACLQTLMAELDSVVTGLAVPDLEFLILEGLRRNYELEVQHGQTEFNAG